MLHAWFGAVAMKRSSRCRTAFLLRCGPLPYTADTPDTSQHPSLRGSAARGSCDTRSAPCSVRSRVSASATPSMVPGGPDSDTCLALSEEPGRHAARSPDTGRVNDRPSDGAPKALELFSQHILQHRLIQAQICNQLFQPAVLFLELFHLPSPIRLHTNILF